MGGAAKEASGALVIILNEPNAEVRRAVATSLGEMKGVARRERVVEVMARGDAITVVPVGKEMTTLDELMSMSEELGGDGELK